MTLHERRAFSVLFTPASLPRTMSGTEEVLHKYLSAERIAVFHIPALITIAMMCPALEEAKVWTPWGVATLTSTSSCSQQPWASALSVTNWALFPRLINDTCVSSGEQATALESELVTGESRMSSCAEQREPPSSEGPATEARRPHRSTCKEPVPCRRSGPQRAPILRMDARVAQSHRWLLGTGSRSPCVP